MVVLADLWFGVFCVVRGGVVMIELRWVKRRGRLVSTTNWQDVPVEEENDES